MTYKPYEVAELGDVYAVFGPTVPPRSAKNSQKYVGGWKKCYATAEMLNDAYAAGRQVTFRCVEQALEWGTITLNGKQLDVEVLRKALDEDDKAVTR